MDERIRSWFHDILQYIDEIQIFIGPSNNFEIYKADLRTKKAVERNLEIIGEAVNRISKNHPDLVLNNARNIIGTRNRIIHSYDSISDEVIWTIVQRDLPNLRDEVIALLDSWRL